MKNFLSVKDNVNRMRRQAEDQDKIFAKDTLIKDYYKKTKRN